MTHTHKAHYIDTPVRCAVITVSDTRTEETDRSGAVMKNRLKEAGHEVVEYRIVIDEPALVAALLDELAGRVHVVLFNGGTGISRRDTTIEALSERLEKTILGFGEFFRMLSYQEIGPRAMLSRAIAGVYRNTLVFSTPGSTNAVTLAMDKLIIPELRHCVWEITRDE